MKLKLLGIGIIFSCLSVKAQSDDPCGATELIIDTLCTLETGSTTGATSTAGVPAPGCGSYTNKDVWYTLTVPATGKIIIETAAGTLTDIAMALYEGVCTSLSLLECDDDSGPGTMPELNVSGLTPGSTVWLRIWRYGGGATGTFQICAWDPPIVDENADCITANQICTTASFDDNNSGDGDVNDLTAINKGCLASGEHQSAWYYFIIETSGTLTFVIDPDVNSDDFDFAVWGPGPACPPTTAPIRCSYAAANGNTGLNTTAADFSEGVGGDKFVKYMDVIAGELYYLCIDNFLASNNGFVFSFGGTATISCEVVVLPVEISYFSGEMNGATNQLYWTTETELNSEWFYIEHASDAENFSIIGKISAQGNSNHETHYNFQHINPIQGLNYYRLRAVDLNGSVTYSEIISLYNFNQFSINVFPNPVENGTLIIEFNSYEDEKFNIELYNTDGKLIQQHSTISNAMNSIYQISLPDRGIYFIKIISTTSSETKMIVF